MVIRKEDMLDTTDLEIEDVAKAFAEQSDKEVVEDDSEDEYVDENNLDDEVVEDEDKKSTKSTKEDKKEDKKEDDLEDEEVEEDEEIDEDIKDEDEGKDKKDEEDLEDEPELDAKKANEAQLSAFAEMKRQKKKAEKEAQELKQTFTEIDTEFAKLAEDSGFEDIGSAEDYLRALRNQRRTTEYKKTNDPTIIADIVADSLNQRQETAQNNRDEAVKDDTPSDKSDDLIGMIIEFNQEFDQDVRSVEDIAELPNAERVIDLMGATYKDKDGNKNSLSLKDAYMIANKDAVLSSKSESSKDNEKKIKQQTINKVKGHNHLKTATKKSGRVEEIKVKRSELNKWLETFPEKSTKQAIKEIKMYKENGHEI